MPSTSGPNFRTSPGYFACPRKLLAPPEHRHLELMVPPLPSRASESRFSQSTSPNLSLRNKRQAMDESCAGSSQVSEGARRLNVSSGSHAKGQLGRLSHRGPEEGDRMPTGGLSSHAKARQGSSPMQEAGFCRNALHT